MNKKNLLIVIGIMLVLIVGALLVWSGGDTTDTPTDTPVTGSPFGLGSDDTVSVPAASRNFQGEVEPLPEASFETGEDYKLFKLSGVPVAGFVSLARGSSTVVRYTDRATGHIFDMKLPVGEAGGESVEKVRITNNTLPQIYEAYFRADGNAVLFRSLDGETVKNMSLSLTASKATSSNGLYSVSLTLLRGSLDGISVGAGDTLVYEVRDSRAVVMSKFSGDGSKSLLSHPFTAWRTARLGTNTLLVTKPSFLLPGYAYSLTGQGALTKLVGPLSGLTAVANPAGTTLLYSYSGAPSLFAKNLSNGTVTSLTPSTLADKCVGSVKEKNIFYCGAPSLGLSGNEPDQWYQGITHFSDNIWSIDTNSESSSVLVEPSSAFGLELDIMNPSLSPDEKYFVFINKRDLSLWALRLK